MNEKMATVGQSTSEKWKILRSVRLTASNFGPISRKKPWTLCKKFVNKQLYSSHQPTKPMKYGMENEAEARLALNDDELLKKYSNISPCGFFIDRIHPFLGAKPDGLVGTDGIVEIKCSYSARHTTIDDAIKNIKAVRSIFDSKDPTKMNENH